LDLGIVSDFSLGTRSAGLIPTTVRVPGKGHLLARREADNPLVKSSDAALE